MSDAKNTEKMGNCVTTEIKFDQNSQQEIEDLRSEVEYMRRKIYLYEEKGPALSSLIKASRYEITVKTVFHR